MIAGGISYYGLSDLMVIEGTMTEFSYAQAILNYKENLEEFKKKNKNIIFEQDGASCHTSHSNKKLLNETFGESGWIQNPPNSPDLAYPIETLWANLKKEVKKKNPQTKEDLKNYCIEEWNKIKPKKYFENFIERIKKCIELKGGRLEDYYLKKMKIKKEKKKKEEEEEEEEEVNNNRKLKRIFNDIVLNKLKKKELAALKNRRKEITQKYSKKIKGIKENEEENEDDFLNLNILPHNKKEKQKKIDEIIKKINEMQIEEYLRHYLKREKKEKESDDEDLDEYFEYEKEKNEEDEEKDEKERKGKKKEEEEDDDDEETDIDGTIEKILKLKSIQKKNKEITYKLNFKYKHKGKIMKLRKIKK